MKHTHMRLKFLRQFSKGMPVLALALTIFLLTGCEKKEIRAADAAPRPVKVVTVKGVSDDERISLPAKTRANRRADISFKVPGPLVELSVEEGQNVKKGQLIARIDSRDFETRVKGIQSSLAEAKARLKSMERGARAEDIRMLESQVNAALAEYRYAGDQYRRYKQLWTKQHASRADFDRQTSLRNTASAKLEAARQDLAKGKKGARKEDIEAQQSRIRGLEADLKAARDALDDTRLRAPFDGVVARRYVENFQEIQAKQPIVFLQDISKIEVLVDVPETIMARMRKGYEPRVVARFAVAPERTFELTLKEFSTDADPQSLTYQAVMVMPQPEEINILPGMTAALEGYLVPPSGDSSRIVIPAVAVTHDPNRKPFVWVINREDMTVKKNMVLLGEITGSDGIEILDGLKIGESIVTAGVSKLHSGMKTIIWNPSK